MEQVFWPVFTGTLCNAKCVFCCCNHDSFKSMKYCNIPVKSLRDIMENLDYIKLKNPMGGACYDGGDISVSPHIIDILKYGKKIGIPQSITTNGIRLNDMDFTKKLLENGLTQINLSIHSYKRDLYNKIMGGINAYEKVIKGWDNCLKLGMKLDIVYTILNLNVEGILGFYLFALKRRPRMITFSAVYPFYDNEKEKMTYQLPHPLQIGENIAKLLKVKYLLDKNTGGDIISINFYNIPFCVVDRYISDKRISQKYFKGMNLAPIAALYDEDSFKRFKSSNLKKIFYKKESCKKCIYNTKCPGICIAYKSFYGDNFLIPISKDPINLMS